MLELLNQLDGFDSRGDVKVIMATNRIESLDPALIRPGKEKKSCVHHALVSFVKKTACSVDKRKDGFHDCGGVFLGRIDRKIEFPLPDVKTRRRIFHIHTSRMNLAADVDLEEFIMAKDELSGADIKVTLCNHGQQHVCPISCSYFLR